MSAIPNVFQSKIFSMQSLTRSINKAPHQPQRIGQMGLFTSSGVTTRSVVIERRKGLLRLLPTQPWDAPANQSAAEKSEAWPFLIKHIPYNDTIKPGDVQDVRELGQPNQMKTVGKIVNERLTRMRAEHDVTREHLMIGAIKGKLIDADGTSVLEDFFDRFGITEESVNFALDVDATKVRIKCLEVKRHIEQALGAAMYTSIHALCGADFFDAFISHPDVEKAYERWQNGEFLRNDPRSGFRFGDIVWEEYRGKVGDVEFIDAETARIFPVGVNGLFRTYNAPADFMETVNTVGLPYYAKSEMEDFDRGIKLHTQGNPLMICTRPEALVEATIDDD